MSGNGLNFYCTLLLQNDVTMTYLRQNHPKSECLASESLGLKIHRMYGFAHIILTKYASRHNFRCVSAACAPPCVARKKAAPKRAVRNTHAQRRKKGVAERPDGAECMRGALQVAAIPTLSRARFRVRLRTHHEPKQTRYNSPRSHRRPKAWSIVS